MSATPTIAAGNPTAVGKNTPRSTPYVVNTRPATMRFVEVPMSVVLPPSTEAFETPM